MICEKLFCLYFVKRLLTQNNIVLFEPGKNCAVAENTCFILLELCPVKIC